MTRYADSPLGIATNIAIQRGLYEGKPQPKSKPRTQWEFRVNGIRLSGDVFTSFYAASERVFREMNKLHHQYPEDRAVNGVCEGELIATFARIRRERPLPSSWSYNGARRDGKPWIMSINRLPYA